MLPHYETALLLLMKLHLDHLMTLKVLTFFADRTFTK